MPVPIGQVARRRDGADVLLVSLGVGVHRVTAAADELATTGVEAAVLAENGCGARYARVTVEETLPFAPALEAQVLPSVDRILRAVKRLE